MLKRVVIKMSGEALAGNSSQNFDNTVIENIIAQIQTVMEKGIQVSVVVGGGNFWRGRSADSSMDRCTADQIGMLATVMNALYVQDSFRQKGVEAIVMTPFTVGSMTEPFTKKAALAYMEAGAVLIFAGGTGHPFFSTDTITSLRAAELEADMILFAKFVDGVYDSDPNENEAAVKFDTIKCSDVISKNLKVVDLAAASICLEQKIPVVIFGLNEENSIVRAATGEKIGTVVTV